MEKEKEKLSLLAENQHYQQRDQTSRTVEVKKKKPSILLVSSKDCILNMKSLLYNKENQKKSTSNKWYQIKVNNAKRGRGSR